ncbi:MAG: UDP-3-O-[3-hydroxymyristoyl] N-acetylglucosamine deacetylase [Candidatus Rokubacteria bacterium]|nr:UDP-3-O-[3-hydroxymyristoyl] N-acetylglucosamine deacetylase [Candidatus Rokubacteria bacterium]
MDPQQTIRKRVTLDGIGLHSGKPVRLTLSPAAADTGIVFRTPDGGSVSATPENVIDSHYATTLGRGAVRVQTVEHLLAAAAALGIDNLDVGLDGSEIPAVDGSAKPFVAAMLSAGRTRQSARRRPITIPCPLRVGGDGRWLVIVPSDRLRISYTLDVDHPAIGTQALAWTATERSFIEEFAPARTYGFLKDLGAIRKRGLARGVSLDNTIGVDERGVLNGLRFRDEFVRHKVLDLVGDLSLLGRPILGHVIARNAGHALNYELVLAIQRAVGLERRPAPVTVLQPAAGEHFAAAPTPA